MNERVYEYVELDRMGVACICIDGGRTCLVDGSALQRGLGSALQHGRS